MPTSSEAFEAWGDKTLGIPPSKWKLDGGAYVYSQEAWLAWQAAYRAGQESMRDRAADVADEMEGTEYPVEDRISTAIRALPIDDE